MCTLIFSYLLNLVVSASKHLLGPRGPIKPHPIDTALPPEMVIWPLQSRCWLCESIIVCSTRCWSEREWNQLMPFREIMEIKLKFSKKVSDQKADFFFDPTCWCALQNYAIIQHLTIFMTPYHFYCSQFPIKQFYSCQGGKPLKHLDHPGALYFFQEG